MAKPPEEKKKKKLRGMQAKMLKGHLAKHGLTQGGLSLNATVVVGLAACDHPNTAAEVHFCSTIICAEQRDHRGKGPEIAYDWDLRMNFEGFPAMKFPAPAIMLAEVTFRASRSGKTIFIRAVGDVSFLSTEAKEDFTLPGSIEDYLKKRYGKGFDRNNAFASARSLVLQYGHTVKACALAAPLKMGKLAA